MPRGPRRNRCLEFSDQQAEHASAAKACTEEKGFIAALKRCATQNHSFSKNCKAGIDFVALAAGLRPRPFTASSKRGFSSNGLRLRLHQFCREQVCLHG